MAKVKIKLTTPEKIDKLCDKHNCDFLLTETGLKKFKKDLLELCKEEYIDGSNACHNAIFRLK